MSVWDDIDAAVELHKKRLAELKPLAMEGRTFRVPRCPTGMWILRTRAGVEPKAEHYVTSFDEAKALLEVPAKRMREVRAAREAERQRRRDELHNRKKKKGGVNADESHVSYRAPARFARAA